MNFWPSNDRALIFVDASKHKEVDTGLLAPQFSNLVAYRYPDSILISETDLTSARFRS